jgi:hypothetical protein
MSFSSWLAFARGRWRLLAAVVITVIVWAFFDEVVPNVPPLRPKDVILLLLISYAAIWVVTLIYTNGRSVVSKINNWIVLKISKRCED